MTRARFHEIAARFPALRLLVVGDLMLDEFIWGRVKRISPEAPVPVVEVDRETSYPGGAANVARNLRAFCGDNAGGVYLLGQIGADAHGAKLRGLLAGDGIRLDGLLETPGFPTIVKTRIIARTQQVVRVDREKKAGLSPEQTARALEVIDRLMPQLDGVIIEDYAKGLLDQPLVDALVAAARRHGKIVTVDPNPTHPLEWRGVTTIKPNRSEALSAAGLPQTDPVEPATADAELLRAGEILLEKWGTESLLITLSEQGIMLFERGEPGAAGPLKSKDAKAGGAKIYHTHTRAQEVYDVSGAGDTTIALFTLALCAGATPPEAALIANHAAGVVVGKLGTATLTPGELLGSFESEFGQR